MESAMQANASSKEREIGKNRAKMSNKDTLPNENFQFSRARPLS
jgi:hypothetical protein